MHKTLIFPSILSADFANFERDVALAKEAGADGIQLDSMDNHFVPNLTFGWSLIEALRKKTDIFLDAHLMIENPAKWSEKFAKAGADNVIFHIEAVKNEREARAVIRNIQKAGSKASIAVKPNTPINKIKPFLDSDLFCILVMTVEPGFGGQQFMQNMMPKVRKAREWITEEKLKTHIQVDGGINLETAEIAKKAGADILVAGSALYKYRTANGMKEAIKIMRKYNI
ncbi:MAG: ribulose-phosphate 3-epimerase [Candidatus Micrarchaeota archaeon]